MFKTNLPGWERVLRALAGTAMIALALFGHRPALGAAALALGGIVLVLTSASAFCPVCAIAGRKSE